MFLSPQRREREILQQLEKKEESTLEIKETFTSLQEEVDLKTKKLNKVDIFVLCGCLECQFMRALFSLSPS